MRVDLFIAFRYLFAKKSHNVINVISAISSAGMALGTAAIILTLSIKETVAECTDEEEREEFEQLNVTRQTLYKRSGWYFWEVTGDNTNEDIYDLLTIRDGEDIHVYGVDAYYKEVDFIENEINNLELLNHCRSFDEIRKIYIQMKNLWDALQEVEEDEILVRNNIYNTFEVEKRFVTQFSEDSQHFAIGLSII